MSACYQSFTEGVKLIIKTCKEQLSKEELTEYVNQKAMPDKYTALLYASFKGNLECIELLMKLGADMNHTNRYGITVMHVAAQGDQPISLNYFKNKGMNLR